MPLANKVRRSNLVRLIPHLDRRCGSTDTCRTKVG